MEYATPKAARLHSGQSLKIAFACDVSFHAAASMMAPALCRDGGYFLRIHSTAALSMRPRHAAIDSAVSLWPVPEWHALCIGHLLHVLRWGGGV